MRVYISTKRLHSVSIALMAPIRAYNQGCRRTLGQPHPSIAFVMAWSKNLDCSPFGLLDGEHAPRVEASVAPASDNREALQPGKSRRGDLDSGAKIVDLQKKAYLIQHRLTHRHLNKTMRYGAVFVSGVCNGWIMLHLSLWSIGYIGQNCFFNTLLRLRALPNWPYLRAYLLCIEDFCFVVIWERRTMCPVAVRWRMLRMSAGLMLSGSITHRWCFHRWWIVFYCKILIAIIRCSGVVFPIGAHQKLLL